MHITAQAPPFSKMTYTVSSGMLNSTISYFGDASMVLFTGGMPFLTPNQKCLSTEGSIYIKKKSNNYCEKRYLRCWEPGCCYFRV